MKNLFNDISQEERKRILEMHENATKRNYLFEQGTPTSASGTPTTNTIARFSTQNPDLYQKFIKIDMNGQDVGKIYSLFDPQGSFINSDNSIPATLYKILSQALGFYASRGKTPNDVKFSEVLTYGGVITAGKEIYKKNDGEMIRKVDDNNLPIKDASGQYVYETNYEYLFGPVKRGTNQINFTNASGGINSAFQKFFDWKLNNSNA
jgi:hypothetical protein